MVKSRKERGIKMKRLLSLAIVIILMFSTTVVSAQIPEILTKPMYNYAQEMNVSMTFESSDQIVALLEEAEFPEEISWFVDLNALLKSLFSYNGEVYVSADMSEDYKKIKLSFEADSKQYIEVNKNLNADITTKTGMWLDMDFSSLENPVLKVIYSAPMLNKYMVMDVFEMVDFEERVQIIETISNVLSKENIDAINTYSLGLMSKYTKIEKLPNKCIITYNNDGLTAMFDEMYSYMDKQMPQPEIEIQEDLMQAQFEMPSLKGIKILGDKGIVCKYNYAGGKINSYEVEADISLNIKELYTTFAQQEWEYENEGQLNFTVKCTAKVKNHGKTKVVFPDIDEENSINMAEEIKKQEEVYTDYTETFGYPYGWVDCEAVELPVINGDMYVPLRETLENAYFESLNISYDKGVITATSEFFPGFGTMSVVIGQSALYTDVQQYEIGEVVEKDGVAYVNYKVFEDVFGWYLSSACYDMLDGSYWYSYTTYE